MQTRDKQAIFSDCFSVHRPGGYLSCYDWTKSEDDYSDDIYCWFKSEGLTYALETLDDYEGTSVIADTSTSKSKTRLTGIVNRPDASMN